jgi:N-acetylglucosaminyl-diphospho-decaprenol L-rhamnosyltransferase
MLTLSVVSHGHGLLLARLLAQLDDQPTLCGTRVVVTLNLSSESLDTTTYPNLDLVVVRNPLPRGFGENHNAAFKLCATPWFGVLNPDLTLVGGEPFTHTLRTALTCADLGVISPRIIAPNYAQEDSVRTNLTPWSLIRRRFFRERKPLDPEHATRRGVPFFWLAGMCMLIDADAFRKIGGFDERFFLYCEDYDLCARLYNAGYAIAIDSTAKVIHEARRDSHKTLRHMRWHLSSLLKVWLSGAFWRVTLFSSDIRY